MWSTCSWGIHSHGSAEGTSLTDRPAGGPADELTGGPTGVGTPTRLRVRVDGTVQGVGFRPFVRNLATGLGLAGLVGNDTTGVFIEVEGEPRAVRAFLGRLQSEQPPLSSIETVTARPLPPQGGTGFSIVTSDPAGQRHALVAADSATCEDCRRELFDPADRRHLYPFINCTNCGPRFTIVRDIPYDRPNTTMAAFAMCQACRQEYEDPTDRRYHAQPTCCPACGPMLSLLDAAGRLLAPPGGAVAGAVELLAEGKVVAIKGLGGYHLAVLAASETAAAALRSRKHREDKPFAVMVRDVGAARAICEVAPAEERLLISPAHPIVLLRRRSRPLPGAVPGAAPVAASVAPGNRHLGLMLPYTPLHHLLAASLGEPFVLTSGNVSDEPIAYRDDDAVARLGSIADAFLTHDRPVHMRTDDSVARVVRGTGAVLRRSRGFVPQPLSVPRGFPRPVLACGAELKNTFCLAKGRRAFVSHHIGDLENYETLRSFREGIAHFCRLFDVRPEVIAHDLHPEYLSTKYALQLALDRDLQLVGTQHHHAHVASCLVDNGQVGPVIGVAFDGLGYGDDGTLWGGEILIANLASFERVGHLEPVPVPGGVTAIKQPWRMAASYLDLAFAGDIPAGLAIAQRHGGTWGQVVSLARARKASPMTSSAGRLFDAVSAVLCSRDNVNYEGQAAVELEQLADPGETSAYPFVIEGSDRFQIMAGQLVRLIALDSVAGIEPAVIAARFHNTLANAIVAACRQAQELSGGLATVALSGGVFQNALLVERATGGLEEAGFQVLLHSRVPTNDGGISLGQAAIAGARDASR